MYVFFHYLELNSSASTQRLPPKCVLLCLSDLKKRVAKRTQFVRIFLSPCGFMKHVPIKASIESGNLPSYDEQSTHLHDHYCRTTS